MLPYRFRKKLKLTPQQAAVSASAGAVQGLTPLQDMTGV